MRRNPAYGRALTPREMDVLRLLMQGETPKTMAPQLGMSYSAAAHHVERIRNKLGARTMAQAVWLYAERERAASRTASLSY